MVKYCCAYKCKTEWTPNKSVIFHKFPLKNPVKLKLWIEALRRENFHPSPCTVICSKHFKESDYLESSKNKNILKQDAVPSVFDFGQCTVMSCTGRRDLICEEQLDVKSESTSNIKEEVLEPLLCDVATQTSRLKMSVEVQCDVATQTSH